LFLASVEETAVESAVKDAIMVLEHEGKEETSFATWRTTTGLRTYNTHNTSFIGPKSIIMALQDIEKSTKPIIAVFFNVRFFIDDPAVVQQIIDTVNTIRTKFSAIIFAGPYLELPPELHDVVTYCEFKLPTQHELEAHFSAMVDEYIDSLPNFPLKDKHALIKKAAISAAGLTLLAAENAFALSLSMTGSVDIGIIQQQKEQDIKKSDVLEFIPNDETMDAVGGFKALKYWLEKRKTCFSQEARDFGLSFPKGVLLVGFPGVGKSLCAKAIAGYLELPLLRMDIGRVYSSYVGSSEGRIRTALKIAEAASPCVLMCDELEKGLAGFENSGTTDSGVAARVVSTLLTWRQETKYPVLDRKSVV
jgi:SpoVK/Ycf46/Vps4 family AAA+-type ATPase